MPIYSKVKSNWRKINFFIFCFLLSLPYLATAEESKKVMELASTQAAYSPWKPTSYALQTAIIKAGQPFVPPACTEMLSEQDIPILPFTSTITAMLPDTQTIQLARSMCVQPTDIIKSINNEENEPADASSLMNLQFAKRNLSEELLSQKLTGELLVTAALPALPNFSTDAKSDTTFQTDTTYHMRKDSFANAIMTALNAAHDEINPLTELTSGFPIVAANTSEHLLETTLTHDLNTTMMFADTSIMQTNVIQSASNETTSFVNQLQHALILSMTAFSSITPQVISPSHFIALATINPAANLPLTLAPAMPKLTVAEVKPIILAAAEPTPDTISSLPRSLQDSLPPTLRDNVPSPSSPKMQDTLGAPTGLPEYVIIRSSDRITFSSETSASVSKINVKEGSTFAKDSVLLVLDCRVQNAELQKAVAQQNASRLAVASARKLKAYGSISEFEFVQAKTQGEIADAEVSKLQAIVEKCTIKAPFNGAVSDVLVHEFETVKPGDPLLKVVGTENLDFELQVPSVWLKWLHVNSPFYVHINELNKTVEVRVKKINPQIDSVSQTVRIIGSIVEPDSALLPGMSGQAIFPENPDNTMKKDIAG